MEGRQHRTVKNCKVPARQHRTVKNCKVPANAPERKSQRALEIARSLRAGQGVGDVDGAGEQHRVSTQARNGC